MRTKAIFDDIRSYSVLDFPSTKPPLNSKGRTRVGNLQRVRHPGSLRQAKSIDEPESGPTDSPEPLQISSSH